jgi:hypothetical protein
MNAPSKKPKAAETVEDVLTDIDKRNANLRIWNTLSRTDPAHTKGFSRAGGFKGTAIKPIWITQRLTELFGPCGKGWGFERPDFQLVTTPTDTLVYCTATAWYIDEGKQHFVYGVGGDKVVAQRQSGAFCDDEAFKKAFTDALGNAFKFVGVGADVHMGLFEDSKYLAEVTAEFHPKPDTPKTGEPKPNGRVKLDGPYTCPTQLMTAAREFVRTLNGIADLDDFKAFGATQDTQDFLKQLKRDLPDWWKGGPSVTPDFVPIEILIAQKKRDLEQIAELNASEQAALAK